MDLGTGNANTLAIVNGCTTTNIAARICNDLVLNGYWDWYLPSHDELTWLYIYQDVVGGFADKSYLSSSEVDANTAWGRYFYSGTLFHLDKSITGFHVRAIRSF